MKNFNSLPEFRRELKKLSRKYGTLNDDLKLFKEVLSTSPIGFGNNFTVIHSTKIIKIVKARMACRSLRNRSLRIIYAYVEHEEKIEFIEIYYKGNKENENLGRIKGYLESVAKSD
ncbi:MAG: hypothetical protein OXH71_03450 [Candidatus Dadabacteria bacterium]|nr:hypothetical protein [Candidatus Dadabacteria bacterium]MDE0519733.1 hypothetical protein [Candidatus Dadabacteria bacterium]MDE0663459.1 hypothetical protein [Candidatus Dadabacteria bacterium]